MRRTGRSEWLSKMLARGYSLTELLIALGAGITLVTACASLGGQFIARSVMHDRQILVTEESLLLQRRIEQQLRRAGFQAAIPADRPSLIARPFRAAWSIQNNPAQRSNSCVLFAYDKNRNGTLDSASPNERLGFRLHQEAVETRAAGLSCDHKGWQDLTSPDIKVTDFSVDVAASSPALIHITLTLTHRSDRRILTTRRFSLLMANHTGDDHA